MVCMVLSWSFISLNLSIAELLCILSGMCTRSLVRIKDHLLTVKDSNIIAAISLGQADVVEVTIPRVGESLPAVGAVNWCSCARSSCGCGCWVKGCCKWSKGSPWQRWRRRSVNTKAGRSHEIINTRLGIWIVDQIIGLTFVDAGT